MKIKMDGEPDDLIRRCEKCNYCIFEDILRPEQRQIKVLDKKEPPNHINRIVVEQLCGRLYDRVCPMKYAAMKAALDDRTAMQIAVVKNYVWDMGKRHKTKISFTTAMKKWTMPQDLGREKEESRAKRYETVWAKGIRIVDVDGEMIEKQLFTADLIYSIIMTSAKDYEKWLKMFDTLMVEHEYRHTDGA